MGVEESPLHPELDVAQLRVIHELWVDPAQEGGGVEGWRCVGVEGDNYSLSTTFRQIQVPLMGPMLPP